MNTNLARHMGPFAGPTKGELCDEIDRLQEQKETLLADISAITRRLFRLERSHRDLQSHFNALRHEYADREYERMKPMIDMLMDRAEVTYRVDFETRDFEGGILRCVTGLRIPNIRSMEPVLSMPDTVVADIMRQHSLELSTEIYDRLMAFHYTPREE